MKKRPFPQARTKPTGTISTFIPRKYGIDSPMGRVGGGKRTTGRGR